MRLLRLLRLFLFVNFLFASCKEEERESFDDMMNRDLSLDEILEMELNIHGLRHVLLEEEREEAKREKEEEEEEEEEDEEE